jgi:hypothetical protein
MIRKIYTLTEKDKADVELKSEEEMVDSIRTLQAQNALAGDPQRPIYFKPPMRDDAAASRMGYYFYDSGTGTYWGLDNPFDSDD